MANASRSQDPTVEISSAVNGAITLHAGELRISNGMTIENVSGAPVTIEQGSPNARVLHVLANPRTDLVTIDGQGPTGTISLTGGHVVNGNGGGILVDNPKDILTLQYVSVFGNSATQVTNPRRGAKGNGGGIYSSGAVSLDHSSVLVNTAVGLNGASGHAGGVYTDAGILLNASHVDSNFARNSAGILNVFGPVDVINHSTVNGNSSSGNSLPHGDLGGGGISEMNGNVVISQSQVSNNKTIGMYSGGIVLLLGGVTVTDHSQINGNTNTGPGGGIAANFGGAVIIQDHSQVNGNTDGGVGGGIVNWSVNYAIDVIDHSQVNGNTSTNAQVAQSAKGLAELFLNHSIANAFVSGGLGDPQLKQALQLFVTACGQRLGAINRAVAALPNGGNVEIGGGVCSVYGAPIAIVDGSQVMGNHFAALPSSTHPAVGLGAGVFSNIGPILIDHSTIGDNVATGDGGGVWSGLSLTIANSTVTSNRALGRGGGIFNRGSFTSAQNTISGNTPDNVFNAKF
jgi:hypothetical protein